MNQGLLSQEAASIACRAGPLDRRDLQLQQWDFVKRKSPLLKMAGREFFASDVALGPDNGVQQNRNADRTKGGDCQPQPATLWWQG
jgi:hypothetical protein